MNISLTSLAEFVRSPKFWLGVGGLFAVVILLSFLFSLVGLRPEEPVNVWRGLTPGESKRADVVKVLGQPLEQKLEGAYQSETYAGDSEFSTHVVFYQEETAVLLKQRIAEPQEGELDKLVSLYGKQNIRLFGPHSRAGLFYDTYPEKGVLLVANPNGGLVFEIWYFVPSALERFLIGPGFELSVSESTIEPSK